MNPLYQRLHHSKKGTNPIAIKYTTHKKIRIPCAIKYTTHKKVRFPCAIKYTTHKKVRIPCDIKYTTHKTSTNPLCHKVHHSQIGTNLRAGAGGEGPGVGLWGARGDGKVQRHGEEVVRTRVARAVGVRPHPMHRETLVNQRVVEIWATLR